MINERSIQEGSSRRNEITRETSREDVLAATRHFFNTVNEWRNIPEVPVTSATGVSQIDTPPVSHDPIETEPAGPETMSPRTYLSNGSPPRPTATATCRPWTWVQCISEGQIEEHSREDDDSLESEPLEPLVLEGLPDELGPEWRVLHPFEILGVRFPTDDTPNHRRLADNDALVELIQMAEYLEDAPSWGQRIFYLPRYGDPFYRGWGRGCGRGRGRGRSWLSEDTTERDSGGGGGRNIGHENGRDRETFPRTFENDRWDGDWSVPTHVDGRYETIQESQEPPVPLPLRFSDWSSSGSPNARTSPHGISNREVGQNVSQPNQLNAQSGTAPREETTRANSQEEVIIPPQINQQSEEQNAQMIEVASNPLNINVRTQRDGIGTDRESNVQITQPSGNMIPSIGLGEPTPIQNVNTELENNSDTLRGSHVRTQELGLWEILVIPPVDRSTSIPGRDRRVISENVRIGQNYPCEGTCLQGTSTSNRRDYPEDSSEDNRWYRNQRYPNERGRPPN